MKKLMVALLVGCLLMGLVTAGTAEAVKSITTENIVHVVSVKKADGTEVDPSLVIKVAEEDEAALAFVEQVLARISSAGTLLIDSFGETVKADLAQLFPDGFDVNALKMYEFVLCEVLNYDPQNGDLIVEMEFATHYQDGQQVAVVVGIGNDAENIEWFTMKAEVHDGGFYVDFPSAVLSRIDHNFLLGVLSEPNA